MVVFAVIPSMWHRFTVFSMSAKTLDFSNPCGCHATALVFVSTIEKELLLFTLHGDAMSHYQFTSYWPVVSHAVFLFVFILWPALYHI